MASVPFFQWDSSNSYGSSIESDSILHRVLDQINFRLRNDQRRTKQYKIMNEASIYDVTEPLFRNNPYNYNPFVDPNDVDAQQCPYFNWPETSQNCAEAAPETMDDDADKILWYRKIFAAKLSIGLFTASKLLIEMFIPMNFEHEITGKLCGALVMISQSVNDVCALKEEVSDSIYYVQDYRDEDIRNSVVLETPRPPFARCSTCSAGFNSLEGGMFHLEKIHFGVDQPQRSPPYNEARRLYLRTPSQIEIEARIKNVVTIVQECDSFIKELRDKANELLIGATRPNSSEGNGYPVMEKLVRVFEHILVLLMLTAHSASRASKLRIENDNDIRRGQKIVAQSLREIRLVYIEAQKYFERAKVDIILASKVDSLTGSLTLASIGPEFLIALVSNGLFLRPLKATSGKSIDACERYKNHTTMLRFQVNHQPKRRLFKDIYGLEEELDILRRVIHWQRKFSNNLMRVLDPKSYKTTTKDRISHYHTEKSYISRTLKHLDERDLEFGALQVRAHRLREQLKQSIEIREESHGKAIRVFTFVTVICH
ncbi:hypothetical protein F4779DRAFT_514754 [Xylariaceae sp. FL0662B]|nr:hypothetical protein F4779DRAFT_514754 [Xylariaceae sp. FL0662B]